MDARRRRPLLARTACFVGPQNHKLEQLVSEMKGAPQSAAQVGGW